MDGLREHADAFGAMLRAHVEELLAEHLVSVDYVPRARPRADRRRRHVVIAPVLDGDDYLAALTAIGRIVTETGVPSDASEWAQHCALRATR